MKNETSDANIVRPCEITEVINLLDSMSARIEDRLVKLLDRLTPILRDGGEEVSSGTVIAERKNYSAPLAAKIAKITDSLDGSLYRVINILDRLEV